MELIDLLKILHRNIKRVSYANPIDLALDDERAKDLPITIKYLLINCLEKKINKEKSIDGADFLNAEEDDASAVEALQQFENDYYEDIWYVSQSLSTPETDSEITQDLIDECLNEIEKFFQ